MFSPNLKFFAIYREIKILYEMFKHILILTIDEKGGDEETIKAIS